MNARDVAGPEGVREAGSPELSVVLPCLNEADTLAACLQTARQAIDAGGIRAEVIVADNGSTDGCQLIARREGARVVEVAQQGYGSALIGGIRAARGRFVIMGDADGSYDFQEIPRFVERLREGYDLVQGCRLPVGGGRILPGAMPFLHRWLGNPMLSGLVRRMFRARVTDVYCGLRGFTRALFDDLELRCTGMEFAIEMVVKASLTDRKVAELPIVLHPDGRSTHAPHLKTFRDGWRSVRFLLLCSPRWLFVVPGLVLIGLGGLGYAVAMPGLRIGPFRPDAHTLLVASLAVLMGYQSLLIALFAKTFAVTEGLLPPDPFLSRFFRMFRLETGILLGSGAAAVGLVLIGVAANHWRMLDWGPLDYSSTMRWVVPGATLTALGFQTILSSFLVSILGMGRR